MMGSSLKDVMTTNKYQVKSKGFVPMAVVAAAVTFCLVYFESPTSVTIVVGLITAIALTIHLRWEYTYSVEINIADKLIIVVSKSRTNRLRDEVPLDEAYFTYKQRFDYYGTSIANFGFRQPKAILQIECKHKTLALLVPGQDGWSDGMILSLARDLSAAGVKQVVEKDNKAEIPITTSSP